MNLVDEIYRLTSQFPKEEIYGLTSRMRRASVSIPSNIAEGKRRGTKAEFHHFLLIAYGSGAELETQIEIAKRQQFSKEKTFEKSELLLEEIMKMLNKLSFTLRK